MTEGVDISPARTAARRSFLWGVVLTVQAVVVAACVPQEYNYFEPSASSGRVEQWRAACGGPNDHITFVAPNYSWVQVRLSTAEFDYVKRAPVPLTFYLTIRKYIPGPGLFPDEEKEAVYDSWAARKVVIAPMKGAIEVSWEGGGHAALPISFPAAKPTLTLDAKEGYFEQTNVIPGFTGQYFDLQMPPFLIDGQKMEFPPVHFQRVDKMAIVPINC